EEFIAACDVSDDVAGQLRARYERRLGQLPKLEDGDAIAQEVELRLAIIEAEREFLHELLRDSRLTDESRRRLERELDLEEAYLSMRTESRPDLPL
ncbi:MAG TPA: Na+/H+ antiporter, partial [Xanthobacteraceae bacterium]|nr:Na+/H+ antiporter [Xanthobacteraceae bacterium]